MEPTKTASVRMTPLQGIPYVGVLMKLHLEEYPESRARDRRNTFIAFCTAFSHQRVTHLTPSIVRAWLLELKEKKGYSDRNLNHIKSDLNHFFRFLVQRHYLPKESPQ